MASCVAPVLQALAPPRDLLRRPLQPQQLRHLAKQGAVRRQLCPSSRPVPPRCRRGLCRPGGVAAVRFPTAPDLRTDHAGRAAKLPRDRPHAPAVFPPQIDRDPVFHCQLPSLPRHPPLLLSEQRWCSLRNLNPPQERLQGRARGAASTSPLIDHPDVRRMLMTMRALTAAARAIAYVTAEAIDRAERSGDPAAEARADLLTPVTKA